VALPGTQFPLQAIQIDEIDQMGQAAEEQSSETHRNRRKIPGSPNEQ